MTWDAADLDAIGSARELEIATRREDGSSRRWTPVWVVVVGGEVFVRTWHRRTTGWYGDAVARRVARVRVPGLPTGARLEVLVEVRVEDIGRSDPGTRARIDAAYSEKYGAGEMSDDGTASTTLRLTAGRRLGGDAGPPG